MNRTILRLLTLTVAITASVAAHADILGVSFAGDSYDISSSTGSGSLLDESGFLGLNSMAEHDGIFYSVSSSNVLLSVDATSGVATGLVGLNFGFADISVRGLAIDSTGTMYAANDESFDDYLYTINIDTGAGTLVGAMSNSDMQGLAFDGSDTLYAWAVGFGGAAGLHTVDTTTGSATDVDGSVGSNGDIQGIDFGPGGTLYGAHDALYTIDTSTGAQTLVGSGDYSGVRGIGVVPEPASMIALALGASALVVRRRRKKSA